MEKTERKSAIHSLAAIELARFVFFGGTILSVALTQQDQLGMCFLWPGAPSSIM